MAGFGKGKFRAIEGKNVQEDNEILFELKSSADPVIINGDLTTVGDALKERRKAKPDAKIVYHDMVEAPGESFEFTLHLRQKVAFRPEGRMQATNNEDDVVASQTNIAGQVPLQIWSNADTGICWNVHWKQNGLMPIRPQVVFLKEGQVPAGRAWRVTAA